MAWTAPMTAVANNVFTAADFNTYVRDNLLETMPAKATEAGQYFVSDGPHSLVARKPKSASTSSAQNITGGIGWVDVTGASVTVTTGDVALVHFAARMEMDATDRAGQCSVRVSGASTLTPDDHTSRIIWDSVNAGQNSRQGSWGRLVGLTPGSNTFHLVGVTASGVTLNVSHAHLIVIPLS